MLQALEAFGVPLGDLTADDLARPDLVFQIGLEPTRIDILTDIDGVTFEEAWDKRLVTPINGLEVPILGRDELVRDKRALGRTKDLADIEALEEST